MGYSTRRVTDSGHQISQQMPLLYLLNHLNILQPQAHTNWTLDQICTSSRDCISIKGPFLDTIWEIRLYAYKLTWQFLNIIAKHTELAILFENYTRVWEINIPRTQRVSGILISQLECHFQLIWANEALFCFYYPTVLKVQGISFKMI